MPTRVGATALRLCWIPWKNLPPRGVYSTLPSVVPWGMRVILLTFAPVKNANAAWDSSWMTVPIYVA